MSVFLRGLKFKKNVAPPSAPSVGVGAGGGGVLNVEYIYPCADPTGSGSATQLEMVRPTDGRLTGIITELLTM